MRRWDKRSETGDSRSQSPAFVGVEAVIADRLLTFGRDVVDDGGEEIGGFEDLEIPLGVVVAL